MSQVSNHKGILLESGTNEVEFLLFRLGRQAYGINVAKIYQIVIYDPMKVAPLPNQTRGVVGVIDYRGQTISVIDLKNFLQIESPNASSEKKQLLLIVEFNLRKNAFIVDDVNHIERCSWKQFESMNETGAGSASPYVVGTINLKAEIVVLLDVENIMATINPQMSLEFYQDEIISPTTLDRSKVSIVSCEDSMVVQKVLLKTLEAAGYRRIKAFSTGAEGLEYLKDNSRENVDIILSDIEMPQMDGLTLCRNIRTLDHLKDVPFLFFSSMINEQMANKCLSVGGNGSFSKPEIHLIVSAIDNLVKESRQALGK